MMPERGLQRSSANEYFLCSDIEQQDAGSFIKVKLLVQLKKQLSNLTAVVVNYLLFSGSEQNSKLLFINWIAGSLSGNASLGRINLT